MSLLFGRERPKPHSTAALTDFAVFLLSGHSAANMALRFIDVQHSLDAALKLRVDVFEPFRNVLMDGTFADAEFFGGLSDGGAAFDNIFAQFDGAGFHKRFHILPLPIAR